MKEEKINMARRIAFDTETTGLDTFKGAKPFLFIYNEGKESCVSRDKEEFRHLLEDESIEKIFHNAKFDLLMLKAVGIDVKGKIHDTMFMAHLIDENQKKSLANCAKLYLNDVKMTDEIELWFKLHGIKKEQRDYTLLPEEIIVPYAKKDAELTYKLFSVLMPKIEELKLVALYNNEIELIEVLMDMQTRGIKIDRKYFEDLRDDLQEKLQKLEDEIYSISGERFDILSGKQLPKYFLKLDIPMQLTEKGNYSTAQDAIADIDHPLPKAILEYRHVNKMLETYVVGLLRMADKDDILHSDLNQSGTVSGRFSGFLLLLPKEEKMIRKGFIPRDGFSNFHFDYQQLEYKIFASYTKDEWLLNEIRKGADFHEVTASALGLSRKQGKDLNFALIYGMGAKALAEKLGVSIEEAKIIKQKYFSRFTTVDQFIRQVMSVARSRKYLINKFNRRYHLESKDSYKGVNRLCQGTGADVAKHTMVTRLKEFLKPHKSNLLLLVHDEFIFEIADEEWWLIPKIKLLLEDWTHIFGVPLCTDTKYAGKGNNWAGAIPWKEKIEEDW
jgi:DNA polymerase-1